jgi:hypothetical protein
VSGRANDEAPHDERDVDRRGALRLVTAGALAAIAGAAAATGATSPAAAGVGTMQFGTTNNAGTDTTTLTGNIQSGRSLSVTNTGAAGYAYGGEAEVVYGGHALVAGIDMTSSGTGARFRGVSEGVMARAENPGGGAIGLYAIGEADAGIGYGAIVEGSTYGARLTGPHAPLWLVPRPLATGVVRQAGEVVAQPAGTNTAHLWFVTSTGSQAVLRKLAGPDTAGQLHVIDPVRVYDSRLDASNGRGPMTSGSSRLVSVANGIDLTTGVVSLTDVVPAGATAIAYNLTVVDTGGSGFLAVTAGSSTTFRASSINWSASGQILANGQLAPLDGERRVRIFAGGGGTAHVLVDVQGYYR